jgi:hypothetical protein
MSFAVEVMNKLIADGLVTSTNFFVGPSVVIPAGPGPFTLLTTTGGSGDELTHNDLDGYARPSAQIIVTASTRAVAEAKAEAIRDSLKRVRNTTLGTCWYLKIIADQQVFDFPLDGSSRPRSGFNISAFKRPS